MGRHPPIVGVYGGRRQMSSPTAYLAAAIPPPRFHMLRYHGVLAAHAKDRAELVPRPVAAVEEPTQMRLLFDGEATELQPASKPASRHPWAWLLARLFAAEVMVCQTCRGPMRVVKIANEPDEIAKVLADVGLRPRPPPRPRPGLPGQLEFVFTA